MSTSSPTIVRTPCPSCGAILNIPSDYPASVAPCPLCSGAVAVPRLAAPIVAIRDPGPSAGLVRPRSRRGNKAEVWAICGGLIAISAILVVYAIQVATAPPSPADSKSKPAAIAIARSSDEPPPPSLRAGAEAILDGRGKDKIYLAADGAWDDLATADTAGIAHLVARGRVLCETNGSKVSLLSEKNGRWKVKVIEGVNVDGEGWVSADDLRMPRRSNPIAARSTNRAPRVFTVNESEAPAKAAVDPVSGFENGAAFDHANPARGGSGGFDNPIPGRGSDFENPVSAGSRRNRMAPRAAGPNMPDSSFGPATDSPASKDEPAATPAPTTTTPDPSAIPPRTPPGGTPR